MTKRKQHTRLDSAQRLTVAQMILTFPEAKLADIAKVAGVSNGTVTNIAVALLR